MIATLDQIKELANAVAAQAEALATGKIGEDQLYAVTCKMHDNTAVLRAWTDPDGEPRPNAVAKELLRLV